MGSKCSKPHHKNQNYQKPEPEKVYVYVKVDNETVPTNPPAGNRSATQGGFDYPPYDQQYTQPNTTPTPTQTANSYNTEQDLLAQEFARQRAELKKKRQIKRARQAFELNLYESTKQLRTNISKEDQKILQINNFLLGRGRNLKKEQKVQLCMKAMSCKQRKKTFNKQLSLFSKIKDRVAQQQDQQKMMATIKEANLFLASFAGQTQNYEKLIVDHQMVNDSLEEQTDVVNNFLDKADGNQVQNEFDAEEYLMNLERAEEAQIQQNFVQPDDLPELNNLGPTYDYKLNQEFNLLMN